MLNGDDSLVSKYGTIWMIRKGSATQGGFRVYSLRK